MIRFQNSLIIERPPEEVFAFLSDFGNMPKWNRFVLEVSKVSEGPTGVGTVYHQVRITDEQQYEITEYEPCSIVAMRTIPPALPLHMRFILEPVGGGTRLTDEWEVETGFSGLFERISEGGVKTSVSENLSILKQLLETGAVSLPDGRRVSR